MLWKELRGRRLGGYKFRRQHGIDIWVVDFYCPQAKLVIELDGLHHSIPEQARVDYLRDKELSERLGIEVLRFVNFQVRNEMPAVLGRILTVLRERG